MSKKSKRTELENESFIPVLPDYDEFKEKLEIDRTDLENTLDEQPQLFEAVSFRVAQANHQRDQRELIMDELYAKLDQQIREEAAANETKITEAAIANKIKLHPDMQTAQRMYLQAKAEAEMWTGLQQSYSQRSYALRDIVAIALKQMSLDDGVISMQQDRSALLAAKSKAVEKKAGELRRKKLNQ